MGCAECYGVYYEKLLPSLRRIHGKSTYVGSRPVNRTESDENDILNQLKSNLAVAIETQNFELAAQLRDEINNLLNKGGRN